MPRTFHFKNCVKHGNEIYIVSKGIVECIASLFYANLFYCEVTLPSKLVRYSRATRKYIWLR